MIINQWLLDDSPLRFNELVDEVGTITNKVLTNSLKNLQEKDPVERTVVNDQPVKVEYGLTERGQSLEVVNGAKPVLS